MTLSDAHHNLIESLDGQTCLNSCLTSYRPGAPEFSSITFHSSSILDKLEWPTSARICDVKVLETDTNIVITTCDEHYDATIETFIFTK